MPETNSGQAVVTFWQALVTIVVAAGGWNDWAGRNAGEDVGVDGNGGNGDGDNHYFMVLKDEQAGIDSDRNKDGALNQCPKKNTCGHAGPRICHR
jgi:hypothetical protein